MNEIREHYSTKYFSLTHAVTEKPMDIMTHLHDGYELFYFLSGDLIYYIEGQAYKLEPHDLIITNAKELHRIVFNSDNIIYERKFIHFKPEFISSFQTGEYNLLYYLDNRKLGSSNLLSASDVLQYGLDRLWHQLELCTEDQSQESNLMIKTIFVQMLLTINKICKAKSNASFFRYKHDYKIIEILDYINQHLEEKISLNHLQQSFYVNIYYLCHIFKMNTGFTVLEYVTYKRIMKAIELISSGLPALEVANAVGYGDYSTFYKSFKSITGYSPKHYSRK